MAPLSRFTFPLIFLVVGSPSLGQQVQPRLPINVFDQSPYSWKYHNWWRPYRTIFDPQKVSDIQRKVDAIAMTEARFVNLEDSLGERTTSSFLYPVLAANGAKGRIILKRYLSEYASRDSLDDRWLLIIAALGRNPSIETRKVLEDEFDRILREYEFPEAIPSNPIQTVADARLPVADALLACMAGQQTLTSKAIEKLIERIHGTVQNQLLWMIGLEWAQALMPEEKVLEIIEGGFSGCTDAELLASMNLAIKQSGRVSVLAKSSLWPRNVWTLTRTLILRKVERRRILSDYLLTLYTNVLTIQADSTDGIYQLDEALIEAFCKSDIRTNRFLAMQCWVLARCRPSLRSPCWKQFIDKHGARLNEEDQGMAQSFLARILGPKTPESANVHDESRPFANITKPGVHLMGFGRAYGRLPKKISVRP